MRRASTCLAVLGLALLALAGTASAAPTVTFKAKAVPIPGFPHTGNIFGAGAAVEAEFHISGTEYGGYSAAADRGQRLPAQGREDPPVRLPHLPHRDDPDAARTGQVPEAVQSRAEGRS